MAEILIRRATAEDAAAIARHRVRMFEEMQFSTAEARTRAGEAFIEWVRPRLASGEYQGWLAVDADSGAILAGAGLWIHGWPPTPDDDGGRRGWIGNVYTEPDRRGTGLARRLMEGLIDGAHREGLVTIWLHATSDGRPLYESLGFEPKPNEMIKRLD